MPRVVNPPGEFHPTLEEIRQRAYQKYCARNGGPGDALADWLQAERELSGKAPEANAKREAVLLASSEEGGHGDPSC
jgi:hypothetical protein